MVLRGEMEDGKRRWWGYGVSLVMGFVLFFLFVRKWEEGALSI